MVISLEKLLLDIAEERVVGSVKVTLTCLAAIRGLSYSTTASSREEFRSNLSAICARLQEARPTLILLWNGLQYVMNNLDSAFEGGASLEDLRAVASSSAEKFLSMINESLDKIGAIGSEYISDGDVILTHACSTTVLAVVTKAHQSGKRFEVITTETRPELQGRFFAMAVADFGIPVTLIIDSAQHRVMNRIKKVFLGAVAIAPSGSVLGRVGSWMITHSAREVGIPVYIVASVSKFCHDEKVWQQVHLEERDPDSIFPSWEAKKLGIKVFNPTYVVVPPEDISLIITERGAIPPSAARSLMYEVLGVPQHRQT